MRVAVIGSGAIGALIAEAAAGGDHEVVVCARSPVDSIVVERSDGTHPVDATIVFAPADAPGPADVVFVTVKAGDSAGVAPWLAALCREGTPVVAVQNGLDHERRLAPYTPSGVRVVPALAYIGAERVGPGRIRHFNGRRLIVPEADRTAVAAALGRGLEVQGTDDILTASWRKLLNNLVANPITALTMRRIDVMAEPAIADLARGIVAEAVLVGRASGVALSDEDAERVVGGSGRYGSETGSSMLYDRLAGLPLEHQYLTGEVVRRAGPLGIGVPLNTAVLALLDALDRGLRSGDPPR